MVYYPLQPAKSRKVENRKHIPAIIVDTQSGLILQPACRFKPVVFRVQCFTFVITITGNVRATQY